ITTLSSGSFDITAAAAKSLTVTVANPVGKALASDVTVTALDVFGNVATGYAGTVSLTSSDTSATLGADSTLTNGIKTFSPGVTFNTMGSWTVIATDTVDSTITGESALLDVNPWFATTSNVDV